MLFVQDKFVDGFDIIRLKVVENTIHDNFTLDKY